MRFPARLASPYAQAALLAIAALLVQAALISNPGYFSHDELQWAARATAGAAAGWGDIDALQYRPLSFAAWMALSRAFFDTPRLFHLAVVLLGTVNVVLLASVLRRAGAAPRVAFVAALAFAASPYAMYVHGWVGTIADVLWVAAALAIGRIALQARPPTVAACAMLLTAAALAAKESALSIPATAFVLLVVDPARRRQWAAVAAGSGAVAIAYLALRYPALSAPRPGDAYAWSPLHVPLRWLEYQVYAAQPRVFEVHNSFAGRHGLVAVSALLWLGVAVALARRGWRWIAAWLLGGAAMLGPVLLLGQSATQYGYAFAAWCAGIAACAWTGLSRTARIVVAAWAFAAACHGAYVSGWMHRIGRVEARFWTQARAAIDRADAPLRLRPAPGADAWIFQRITHEVPTYRGAPYSPRMRWVDAGQAADYDVGRDGALTPVR